MHAVRSFTQLLLYSCCFTQLLYTPDLLSFTGFTITKVQMLTPDELQAGDDVEKYMFKQTKAQKLFLGEGPWAHVPVEHEMSGDGAQASKVACIHTKTYTYIYVYIYQEYIFIYV